MRILRGLRFISLCSFLTKSAQGQGAEVTVLDDKNSPMIYETPVDYASSTKKLREELHNQGEEAVLMSELCSLIPRMDGQSDGEYARLFSDEMNKMIRNGVQILDDKITHDVVPSGFFIDGREFDVGPNSGIRKKEYNEFSKWTEEDVRYEDIPQRFLKYEVPRDLPEEAQAT